MSRVWALSNLKRTLDGYFNYNEKGEVISKKELTPTDIHLLKGFYTTARKELQPEHPLPALSYTHQDHKEGNDSEPTLQVNTLDNLKPAPSKCYSLNATPARHTKQQDQNLLELTDL